MKKKERLVSLIMAVVISAVMGLLFPFITRRMATSKALESMPPAAVMYITSVVESIIVGVLLVIIIPIGKLGMALAKMYKAKPGSMKFNLINSIPFAVISAVVVGGVCSFAGIASAHSHMPNNKPPLFIMWFSSYIKMLPVMIGVSYILAIILAPIVVKKVGLGRPNVEGQGMGTHDRAHFERPDVEGPVEEDDDF